MNKKNKKKKTFITKLSIGIGIIIVLATLIGIILPILSIFNVF